MHHQQPFIDKKHQLLTREEAVLKHFKDRKPFIEYSNDMNDV